MSEEIKNKDSSEESRTYLEKDAPHLVETRGKLDAIGKGMCLAKWTQVTIHLQNGHNHSCHHPRTHKVSESEILRNPTALHNTNYKKKRRKEMLVDNKRPVECDYCWGVEDNSDRMSDRIFKSSESWSLPHYDEIVTTDWREDFNPRYVEVSFSNACNFKCSYCGPTFSSTWMEEVEKHGGYSTTTGFNDPVGLQVENKMPIPHKDPNPYKDAFWKWWPDLYQDLHTFRITGGEPLLANDTFKVLDYIIDHPNPNKNLGLAINSNLGGPVKLIDKFIEKLQRIEDEERVKEIIIFTSVDGWGNQAEWIRNGLDFNYFWDNCYKVLEQCQRINLTFMSTYNALSIPSYKELIHGVYDLKEEFNSNDRYWNSATFLDSSYLRYPQHQTVQIMEQKWAIEVFKQAQLMDFLAIPIFEHMYVGYSDIEIQKVKRIYDWMVSPINSNALTRQRHDFGVFVKQHDERRGTNFVKAFPELEEFYQNCLEIKI